MKNKPKNPGKKKFRADIVLLIILSLVVFGGLGYLFRDKLQVSLAKIIQTTKKGTYVTVKMSDESESKFVSRGQGGKISVESIDGYTQELDIEKNTLLTPADFTVESIESISNLPEGTEFIAGTHITSDAILENPALISFEIPTNYQDENIMGFAYEDEGNDWHLYPMKIEGNIATMQISHFSGYGLIAIAADYDDLPEPDSIRAQAEQNLSRIDLEIATSQRAGEQEDITDDQYKRIENILSVWYRTSVKKHLDKAQKDDEHIMVAATEFIIWKGRVEYWGREEIFGEEIQESYSTLAVAIKSAVDKAYEKCQAKDATQAGRLMKLYALSQMLADEGVKGVDIEGVKDKAYKCANFNLQIKSVGIDSDASSCADGIEEYSGEIELIMDSEERSISGSGTIYGRKEECGVPCYMNHGSLDIDVSVPKTIVDIEAGKSKIELVLELDLDVNNRFTCEYTVEHGAPFSISGGNSSSWTNFLYEQEDVETNIRDEYVTISNWEILGKGEVYARKTWSRDGVYAGFYDKEDMVMELIHMPK